MWCFCFVTGQCHQCSDSWSLFITHGMDARAKVGPCLTAKSSCTSSSTGGSRSFHPFTTLTAPPTRHQPVITAGMGLKPRELRMPFLLCLVMTALATGQVMSSRCEFCELSYR